MTNVFADGIVSLFGELHPRGLKFFLWNRINKQITNGCRGNYGVLNVSCTSPNCGQMSINYLTEPLERRQIWWNFYALIICLELILIKRGLIYIHIWGTAYRKKELDLTGNIKVFICSRKMWPTRDRPTESILKPFCLKMSMECVSPFFFSFSRHDNYI